MRSIRRIMQEQARASRERAQFYRDLARSLSRDPQSVSVFEKSAGDLEARAEEMEKYARWFVGPGEPTAEAGEEGEGKASDANVVGKLQRALQLALSTPKKLDAP